MHPQQEERGRRRGVCVTRAEKAHPDTQKSPEGAALPEARWGQLLAQKRWQYKKGSGPCDLRVGRVAPRTAEAAGYARGALGPGERGGCGPRAPSLQASALALAPLARLFATEKQTTPTPSRPPTDDVSEGKGGGSFSSISISEYSNVAREKVLPSQVPRPASRYRKPDDVLAHTLNALDTPNSKGWVEVSKKAD